MQRGTNLTVNSYLYLMVKSIDRRFTVLAHCSIVGCGVRVPLYGVYASSLRCENGAEVFVFMDALEGRS